MIIDNIRTKFIIIHGTSSQLYKLHVCMYVKLRIWYAHMQLEGYKCIMVMYAQQKKTTCILSKKRKKEEYYMYWGIGVCENRGLVGIFLMNLDI